MGEPIGTRIGLDWAPPTERLARTKGRKIEFTVTSPRDASIELRSQLTALMKEQGNFLRLMLVGTNPARLTTTMNALINQYVDVAAELKRRNLAELSSILAQQLDTVGKQLKDAESQLQGHGAAVEFERVEAVRGRRPCRDKRGGERGLGRAGVSTRHVGARRRMLLDRHEHQPGGVLGICSPRSPCREEIVPEPEAGFEHDEALAAAPS